jgi:hypothetical protein
MRPTHPALALLDRHLSAGGATCSVNLGRDENDEYGFTVEPAEGLPCSPGQIIDIMPAGSFWSHLLGWHSFVGIPFPEESPRWMALGVETVAPHPTRGAYLLFKAYLFELPLAEDAISRLESLAREMYPPAAPYREKEGFFSCDSMSAEEHAPIAARVIFTAAEFFRCRPQSAMLFRTAVMTEQQRFTRQRPVFMVTVPPIRRYFSTRPGLSLYDVIKRIFR